MDLKSASHMKSQKMGVNVCITVKAMKLVKRKKPHHNSVVIESEGDLSYAEILRKVKGDTTLSDLGDKATRIRRKPKGELELRKRQDERMHNYQNLVGRP